jgi:hypothetical protein
LVVTQATGQAPALMQAEGGEIGLHDVADLVEVEIVHDHALRRDAGERGLDAGVEGGGISGADRGDRQPRTSGRRPTSPARKVMFCAPAPTSALRPVVASATLTAAPARQPAIRP